MNGLQLLGTSEDNLEKEIKSVKVMSNEIKMNSQLEKC
jgi:hypothetical protein